MAAAGVVWLTLLGPLWALLTHLSASAVSGALDASGALAPLAVSAESGAVALTVLVALGTPLGYLLARERLPWPRVWETGLLVMLLMPPLVVGLLLVFMVGPLTAVGHGLSDLHLSATNTFAAVDPRLEQQAALLGDRPLRTLRRITLPLAGPGLASALATGWARAIGAFGAVIIVAYHPYGLPMQIWTTLNEVGLSSALPFALLLLVVALPVPVLVYGWSRHARG